VRGNDNSLRTAYVNHDADAGIHLQSSTFASRPAAGTAGRKWITTDAGSYKLWFDDGTRWHEIGNDAIDVEVIAAETIAKGDVLSVTSFNNGLNLAVVSKFTGAAPAFAIAGENIANGARGYVINTGILLDVDTQSFGASGTVLYPAATGTFTSTKPTSGVYQVSAYVLRQNSTNGVLFVEFSASRIVERSDNTASTIVLRDASGNFAAGTITAGAVTSTGLVTVASLKGTGATTVTNILDEDNMASDSATALATQQSIKAYVDAQVATVDTLAEVLANGNTTGANNIIVSSGQKVTTNTIDETTAAAGVTIDSVLLKDDVVNATDIEVDTLSANNGTLAVTLGSTGVATLAQQPIVSSLTASQAVFTDGSKGLVSNAITGTGNVVMSASPTLTGTVTAATLNATTLGGTLSTAAQTNITSVGTLSGLTVTNPITGSVTGSSGSTTGNAATATTLQTARNINGVSFNGSADITVTAAAGTLSGATLASGVTASSLTSVGTLASLTVSGAITGATSTNTINGLIVNSGALSGVSTIGTTGDITTTANTNAGVIWRIINASAGASASADLRMDNDVRVNNLTLRSYSNATGSTIPDISDSVLLRSNGAGGLTISAQQAAGVIRFSTGGTTEKMRIDASGNVGIGVTPSYRLHVSEAQSTAANNTATGSVASFNNSVYVRQRGLSNGISGVPYTSQLFAGPDQDNFEIYNAANYALVFGTNATERARITAGGYFKASDTGTYISAAGASHEIATSSANALEIYNTNANPVGVYMKFTNAAPDNNTNWFLRCDDNASGGTVRLYIWADGDLANHDGVYGTISDAKLKQDIVDAGSQWDDLKNIRFRKYRFISDVEAKGDDAPYLLGVVAQELEQTSPGLVDEHSDTEDVEVEVEVEKSRPVMQDIEEVVTDEEGVESVITKSVPMLDANGKPVTETYTETETRTERQLTGTTTKSVKSSILLMKAAVALQEAMARIESLEARLDAMEN
jgi:hypothetical protein